ncbi:hypothetical protein NLI96_g7094 [Meripilus lineatus]|uniref:Pre-rRNA-processing protein TSR2 n=1 Tax=Meripilus lineatus TaxID=2056292 RepID=A0AAD5UZS6_9APHY|nr:hypothetical protein NLI96_g7094 [Physisporinus lineatus]
MAESSLLPSATSSPPQTSILFARGVIARLATWPALRVAVDENWGGPDSDKKRTWLASVVVDAFEQEDPLPDGPYIELMLLQVLEDEFDVTLEDGSAEQIADDIVRLWEEVHVGKSTFVTQLEERAERTRNTQIQVKVQQGDGEDDDWESDSGSDGEEGEGEGEVPMLIDSSTRPEPGIDEDGFTTVKGKGTKHR